MIEREADIFTRWISDFCPEARFWLFQKTEIFGSPVLGKIPENSVTQKRLNFYWKMVSLDQAWGQNIKTRSKDHFQAETLQEHDQKLESLPHLYTRNISIFPYWTIIFTTETGAPVLFVSVSFGSKWRQFFGYYFLYYRITSACSGRPSTTTTPPLPKTG